MSNSRDELISAWIDSETTDLTPAELAQLAELKNDANAQELAQSFQQQTEMIQSLPRAAAPDGFADQVLARAAVTSVQKTSLPGRWLIPAAIASAVAACVMIIGPMLRSPEMAASIAQPSAINNSSGEVEIAQAELSESFDNGTSPELSKSTGSSDLSPASQTTAADSLLPEKLGTIQLGSLRFDDKILQDATVGQVVNAIDTADDEMAVVKLTVVNRQAGMKKLELILARNDFKSTANSQARVGEMMSVMVEATPDQLADCVIDLRAEDLFEALELATDMPENSPVSKTVASKVHENKIPRYSTNENAPASKKSFSLKKVLFVLEPRKPDDASDSDVKGSSLTRPAIPKV